MPLTRSSKKPKRNTTSQQYQTMMFDAIGTAWLIHMAGNAGNTLEQKILTRIDKFDQQYSRFREDSLVTEISRASGTYTFAEDANDLFTFYEKLYHLTNGLVTPLIGQTLSDAGYDAAYSLQPKHLTTPPRWETVLSYTAPNLTTTQPALLDFGAAGKGYLVDIIAALLTSEHIDSFSINAGGDIYNFHAPAELAGIALEHPDNHDEVIGLSTVITGSICGSAGNRRTWDSYTHILNPDTLQSPTHLKAVWVAADTALVADGLATALFFVSPDTLRDQFQFDYALIRRDMSLEYSTGFPAAFFSETEDAI